MRASRLLSILILLQLRQRLTADALAVEFGVSVRTIYRDIDELSAAGIPCGMVRDIGQALSLPALDERALRIALNIPGLPVREDVAVLGPGFISSQAGRPELTAPPTLGQHTEQIRAWLAKD